MSTFAIPDPYNPTTMLDELTAAFPSADIACSRDSIFVDDPLASDSAIQAVIDAHDGTQYTTEQQALIDGKSLQALGQLALDNSKPIKALFEQICNDDLAEEEDLDTRVTHIANIILDSAITGSGFKARFNSAFNAEYGIDISLLDLIGLLALTTAQKQRYCIYTRAFTGHYSQLLNWALSNLA